MHPVLITDPADPRVAAFRLNERGLNPRFRRREITPPGLFVAEGDLVVERALRGGCRPRTLLATPRFADALLAGETWRDVDLHDVTVCMATDDIRRTITGLGVPLEVVGLFERPPERDARDVVATARNVVVIDRVDNPTNVGTIVRSATALGADALVLDRTSADPLTRRALRVSMGTALAVPTTRVEDAREALEVLHASGIATVALTPDDDAVPLGSLPELDRVAIVLGAERSGLSSEAMAGCRYRARIPMSRGVDSLNVAAAAAVACFALFTAS